MQGCARFKTCWAPGTKSVLAIINAITPCDLKEGLRKIYIDGKSLAGSGNRAYLSGQVEIDIEDVEVDIRVRVMGVLQV
jgi:hypothetical protein